MTKSALSSTGMNATSSVRRPMSRDSYVKNSVLVESKNAAKKEGVYVRKNKQPDNTFANVVSNKEDVIDVDGVGPSVEEQAILLMEAQDHVKKKPLS
ncbi:hypothetical protein Tco_0798082 [Tanacetum coccineum]